MSERRSENAIMITVLAQFAAGKVADAQELSKAVLIMLFGAEEAHLLMEVARLAITITHDDGYDRRTEVYQ